MHTRWTLDCLHFYLIWKKNGLTEKLEERESQQTCRGALGPFFFTRFAQMPALKMPETLLVFYFFF